MKERPILFSAPMVRAILAGTKTQTRRVVKPHRSDDSFVLEDHGNGWWPYRSEDGESSVMLDGCEHRFNCPYGQPGDRLYVKETWSHDGSGGPPIYMADLCERDYPGVPCEHGPARWSPSIHMPRWASRITLEITGVRVERLQDISEQDAMAEGVEPYRLPCHPQREALRHVDGFCAVWESIYGPGSWERNPWVWAITFTRVATK